MKRGDVVAVPDITTGVQDVQQGAIERQAQRMFASGTYFIRELEFAAGNGFEDGNLVAARVAYEQPAAVGTQKNGTLAGQALCRSQPKAAGRVSRPEAQRATGTLDDLDVIAGTSVIRCVEHPGVSAGGGGRKGSEANAD